MQDERQEISLPRLAGRKRDRLLALRSSLVDNLPGICAERARIYTQIYQQYESDSPILKRAKALRAYLEGVSLPFGPHDLIPGWQASQPRWAPVFPEYSWEWVYDELDQFELRKYDRYHIPEPVKEELRQVLPWWRGRTLYERVLARQPGEVLQAANIGAISWTGQATSGEGHIVVDFRMALEQGFESLRQRAGLLSRELDLSEPGTISKIEFYRAVEIACDGVIRYAERLANRASMLVEQENDPDRAAELYEMAADLRMVPALPARSFRQALFTVWLVHLIQQMESNGHSVSMGRLDQLLYPYYARDLQSGRITGQDALELLEHFYLKIFSIIKLRSASHSRTQTGYPTYQNICVGGQDTPGRDATNPLSYLCLAALAETRLSEPNFYVRVHPGMPQDFLQEALKVMRLGFGMPAFVNDSVIVPSLEKRRVSHEDALNYSTMGCVEVLVPGKWGYRVNGKSKLNVLKVLELAIHGGRDPLTGLQMETSKGDLTRLLSFEDLVAAWRDQLNIYTRLHVAADNIIDQTLEEMVPNAFCSLLVQDCLGRGRHLNQGGAVYDSTSGCLVGIPNVGNALAALQKLVYEEKRITPEALLAALQENFASEDGAEIRQLLVHVPKYGEDEHLPDSLTAMALNDYCTVIDGYKNVRNGRGPIGGGYFASTNTVSANITSGEKVAATPDGRLAFQPTADGVSPAQGTGRLGPTAIFHSVSKLPTVLVTGGQLLNIRINQNSLKSREAVSKLAAMLKTFFEMDGWHVQFNTISTEILRDAILHPENYADLIVRVAGYSALFVALDPSLQRDILSRMEYEI